MIAGPILRNANVFACSVDGAAGVLQVCLPCLPSRGRSLGISVEAGAYVSCAQSHKEQGECPVPWPWLFPSAATQHPQCRSRKLVSESKNVKLVLCDKV